MILLELGSIAIEVDDPYQLIRYMFSQDVGLQTRHGSDNNLKPNS